jgi:diacylglycerol O-acyltransferase
VGELVAEVISELLEFQFKGLYLVVETVSGLLHVVHRQLGGMDLVDEHDPLPPAVSSMRGPVPRNAFSAPLTDRRAVAFASICQADLEAVSTAFGGDVTNVLLAACTLSLRAWLQRYDTVPDRAFSR